MRQTLSRGMVAAAAATSILSLCGSSPALADSDASSAAKGSPGVLSGNDIQVPVDAPVNACGNSVDVIALLNPAFGNSCANESGSHRGGASYGDDSGYGDESGYGGGGHGPSGHATHGRTEGSPGVLSGNNTQAPVEVPVNACGNTADVISGLNPAYGDDCGSGGHGDTPGYGDTPTPTPPGHGEETPTPTPTPPGHGEETPTPTPSPPGHGEETPTPTPTPPGHGEETPTPTPPTNTDSTPPGPHGPPPQLPDTGSNEAMLAASVGSAAMIAAGAVLYRRGRRQAGAHQ
ncbi:chaplin family protein [Streptomyces sp. NPDC002817]|uniref:chaplin n=1 Tax=Streptomyces sp. NPDC088357 TaxID=3154655 RepID=UPI0034359483